MSGRRTGYYILLDIKTCHTVAKRNFYTNIKFSSEDLVPSLSLKQVFIISTGTLGNTCWAFGV